MRIPAVIFVFLLYCCLWPSVAHAQKRYDPADSIKIKGLLKQADELIRAARYDSANRLSEQVIAIAGSSGYKRGEAYGWDRLSEVMAVNGRMKEVRYYDSLVMPVAQHLKDTQLLQNTYNRMGVYLMEQGRNKESEKSFLNALALGLEKDQSNKTAEVYGNMASLHLAAGEKDKAVDLFFKALRLFEKSGNERGQGETYSNISSILFLMGRTDESINYIKQSIALREKQNDIQGLVIPYSNIAQLYILKDSMQAALYYQKLAISKAEQINNPKSRATAYMGLGAIYNRQKNYEQALFWQKKAIQFFEEIDDKPVLSRLYGSVGGLSSATGDSVMATSYFNKALGLSLQLGNKDNIMRMYERLSNFYQLHNDPSRAYTYYKQYVNYHDSISTSSNLSKIEEIKTKFETEKKDAQISMLKNEKRIQQLELEKQQALIAGNLLSAKQKQNEIDLLSKENELRDARLKQQGEELEKQVLLAQNQQQQLKISEQAKDFQDKQLANQKQLRNVMIACIVVFLILAIVLFNRYQLKKKLQQQAELLNVRNDISRNLHDDIGASLSNIGILNELAKRNTGNKEKVGEYLGKAGEDIQRISESLSDIVWNINPKYDDLDNLFVRMKRYGADMLEGKNIAGELVFPEESLQVKLSMVQRRDLYLIYKEVINNLVKYSEAGRATVQVQINRHHLGMEISDDGKGFDPESNGNGNGLNNIRQRALSCNGTLDIHSAPGKGTRISFTMPLD